jgi:methanogenic corrinoid protein MtbC1
MDDRAPGRGTEAMGHDRDLATLLSEFDEEAALATVNERLAAGEDPMVLVDECRRGMQIVGERYQEGVYYISALIMAGEVLREVLEILGPRITGDAQDRLDEHASGLVLVCTVKGDIHDVGKDIASTLLRAHGFSVVDLGVDVSPARVADAVDAQRPDVVGLSGLLTVAFESMRLTVKAIRERTSSWDRCVPIVLGGSRMNEQVRDYTGADGWCTDAVDGVRLVRDLLAKRD